MIRPIRSASLAAALWLGVAGTSAVLAETTVADRVPAAAAAPDVQDMIFLGDDRPILIRLHVQANGKSFALAWDNYLRAVIKYLDRDNDGVLSETEAKFVPSAQLMLQAQQNGFFFGQNNFARFADLKKDPKATRISFEDLSAYYRKAGVGTIRVSAAQQNFGRPTHGLTDALFKALDTDGDGRISKAELQAAEKSLLKLDADDDETISAAEVLGVSSQQQFFGMAQPATALPLVGIDGRGDLTALGTRILSHYDRDKNQKLTREEIGFDTATFDKLDLNRDGALNTIEVLGLLRQEPAVELIVGVGKLALEEKPVQSVRPLSPNLRATAEGMVVTLGNTQIDFSRTQGQVPNNFRQFYLQQFRAIQVKKKQDYIEVADFDNRQLQFLKPLMPLLDRNGDGKLKEKELTEYLDLQDQAVLTTFSVQVGEGGQGLFELLDANRDGRLSVKELRTAWDRLATWDKNGDGIIARSEIPRQMDVTVTRGPITVNRGRMMVVQQGMGFNPAAPRVTTKGPLWFRKMDRNGDGVLSPREFLGSAEDFKKLDRDGDGFIDADEAEKAGEVLGKRADAKP